MKGWRKSMLVLAGTLTLGMARLPYEAHLSQSLREAGLFPPKLQIDTLERIDQTRAAVALGGLRTLVATFLNLRAYTAFTERRWVLVAETFESMVALAPHTRDYWEMGAWHLAYNAASYYRLDSTLSPLRRREAWRTYVAKGRLFLERGIRNNPNDWSLPARLGILLSDPNKFPAFADPSTTFAAAAQAYHQAAATGKAPSYTRRAEFYALARIPGREAEALDLGHRLYAEGPINRTPTLRALVLVLEARANPSLNVAQRAIELFESPTQAYSALSSYWRRTRERFPVFGVVAALRDLENLLGIPHERSVLRQALPAPDAADSEFDR